MPTSRQYFKGHRSKGVACMQLFESVMTKYYLWYIIAISVICRFSAKTLGSIYSQEQQVNVNIMIIFALQSFPCFDMLSFISLYEYIDIFVLHAFNYW